ncbi:MAG: glycosyltransferase family 2 protein [Elusimicrobia bacterium]|nr:glycosyltransferase family 2 protein [Candidatus Liberimonas magnetica]
MAKALIIITSTTNKEKEIEYDIDLIGTFIGKERTVIYFKDYNVIDLKKLLVENEYEYIIIFYSSIFDNFDRLQMIRSLAIKSKLVMYCPDISLMRTAQGLEDEINENNDLKGWYVLGERVQSNIYRQSDLIVTKGSSDKEILKREIDNIEIIEINELTQEKLDNLSKKRIKVSIIMLTFNQCKLTQKCVESIKKYTGSEYELIVVDNGSEDDTKEYLEQLQSSDPGVKVIINKTNIGFARGNNQGIQIAKSAYILLLNNDVILTDNWLERLLMCAQSDPCIGVVGPCTNNAVGQQVVAYDGSANNLEIQKYAHLESMKNAGAWFSVHRIIGFCMLIKKEVIEKVGMLDERFGPGGYEDYDFCLRVKQARYKIMVANDVFIYHIGGQGYSNNNLDYDKLRCQNVNLFVEKWVKKALEIIERIPDKA